MSKDHQHLYEIHTKPQPPLVTEVPEREHNSCCDKPFAVIKLVRQVLFHNSLLNLLPSAIG
jgi:hypothetical protein